MTRWGIFRGGALVATVLHPSEPVDSAEIGIDLTGATVAALDRVPDPRFETAAETGAISVDTAKAAAVAEGCIDGAFEARLAIIAIPEMKQRMHRRKEAEARRVEGPGTTGVPMLEAEADETGTDIVTLAAEIIANADAAVATDAGREAARRKAKIDVRAAATPEAMQMIITAFRQEVAQWN